MGTISDKLTYLNTTKGLIKDTINLTGAGITNDTFRSYANKLKLGLINALNDNGDTIYSNLEKVSGIGSNLSLTPTYEAPMRNREIYGNTSQTGTPTPSSPVPIQSVTGLQNVNITNANKLPYYQQASHTSNGITHYSNGDGTFTFSNGTASGISYWDMTLDEEYTIQSGDYLQINNNKALKDALFVLRETNVQIGGFNCKDNTNKIYSLENYVGRTISVVRTYFASGVTTSDFEMKPMICNSSTQVPFVVHSSNTYEVNLGKNLFNIQTIVKGRLDNGVIGYASDVSDLTLNDNSFSFTTTANYRGVTSDYIKVNNTKYVFSNKNILFGSQLNVIVACYDNSKTFLSNASLGSTNLTYMVTTLPSNTSYIRVYLYLNSAGTITIEEPQLERGSQATSYSEYFPPIELNKIGTYQDSIKKSTGKNLFDKDNVNVINAYIDGTSGVITSDSPSRTIYIPCKSNTTYTISKIVSSRFRVSYSSSTPAIGTTTSGIVSDYTNTTITITTGANANYLVVWLYNSNSDTSITLQQVLDSIMINEGSTALPYEPYGKVWYITENEIKYNVDTTQLTLKSNYTNIEYAEIPKPSNFAGYDSWDHNEIKYTNAIWLEMGGWDSSNNIGKISGNADKFKWWVGFTKGTGLEAIKTALTGSYIIYPLATPIYEVITNTELINQLESLYNAKSKNGTTNIVITSQDLAMIMNVNVIKGDA